jgi:hypothetical protein
MMEDQLENRNNEQKPENTGSWDAFLIFIKKHAVILGIGVPLLAGVFNAGGRLKGIEDTLVDHGKEINSLQDNQDKNAKKLDRICYRLSIPCSPDAPYYPPSIVTDPGTATAAPPVPHSKLGPSPSALAQKDKPAPISFNQPTY